MSPSRIFPFRFVPPCVFFLLLFLLGTSLPTFAIDPGNPKQSKSVDANERYIVRYAQGHSVASLKASAVFDQNKVTRLRGFKSVSRLDLIKVAGHDDPQEVMSRLRNIPGVEYAEPDYVHHATATLPNDTHFNNLWGLNNTGQTGGANDVDMNAPEAWDVTTGSANYVVGVIDSGIDHTHPDLVGNLWVNPGEIPGNGIDDDANGFIDDIHGINAITMSGNPMDDNNHGTHVAGTIGAAGNNTSGVTGVNWQTSIASCKFLDNTGNGFTSDAITCLDYFLDLKNAGVDIVVTNNSWGGGGYSQALADAIAAHQAAGILFVAAAGNDALDNDVSPHYPSSLDNENIISVASIDHHGALSGFSNYGANSVDIGAPGSSILSTFLGGGYVFFNGTSMATPHVAGLVALTKAALPSLNWDELKRHILVSGQPNTALAGKSVTGRHIRAHDVGGLGALTCNISIANTNAPRSNDFTVEVGQLVTFSAYHSDCFTSSGGLSVTENNVPVANLEDDGLGMDLVAGDSVYSGSWQALVEGPFQLELGGAVFNLEVAPPYPAPDVQSGNYRSISGTLLPLTDDSGAEITLPFDVTVGHSVLSSLIVGSNGCVGTTAPSGCSYLNTPLPASGLFAEGPVLAPLWDDWNPSAGGGVYWDVLGSVPNREIVIEWRGVPHFNTGLPGTFQVVLFESSDDVEFNYQTLPPAFLTATVGVQLSDYAVAQYSYNNSPALSNGLSLHWEGYDAAPGVGLATDITLNAASYSAGDPHLVNVSIMNTGPDELVDVYVYLTLPDASVYFYNGSGLTPTASPIVSSWNIVTGYNLSNHGLLGVLMPALPLGAYSWSIGFMPAGVVFDDTAFIASDSEGFDMLP
ncbi:S8 family peptidase [Litoribacillus peritrichatus]|uniref:Peptidase S8/S53 domain-containing protein n=1 Tax=Litoribacillus peritrichatus TaxID=718191 RepID=A0ABP7N5T5_9GAMM